MAKIAVIKTGGKQYKVREGQILKVEKLPVATGEKIKFDTLMIADVSGDSLDLGKPSLGERVEGEVLSTGKGKKTLVVKYKSKTRYKKTLGHRQEFSEVKINKI